MRKNISEENARHEEGGSQQIHTLRVFIYALTDMELMLYNVVYIIGKRESNRVGKTLQISHFEHYGDRISKSDSPNSVDGDIQDGQCCPIITRMRKRKYASTQ